LRKHKKRRGKKKGKNTKRLLPSCSFLPPLSPFPMFHMKKEKWKNWNQRKKKNKDCSPSFPFPQLQKSLSSPFRKHGIPQPNPKSQSFSQSFGFYFLLSLSFFFFLPRGFLPWRPAAVMSTNWQENDSFPLIFKDCRKCPGHFKTWNALPVFSPSLRLTRFQGDQVFKNN